MRCDSKALSTVSRASSSPSGCEESLYLQMICGAKQDQRWKKSWRAASQDAVLVVFLLFMQASLKHIFSSILKQGKMPFASTPLEKKVVA